MFLVIFEGNLLKDKLIIMAEFCGDFSNIDNLEKLLKTKEVMSLLKKPEFVNFWFNLFDNIEGELEMELVDDVISEDSFNVMFERSRDVKIFPILSRDYSKKQGNCIAIIEDGVLLDILKTCSNLVISMDYPKFYS